MRSSAAFRCIALASALAASHGCGASSATTRGSLAPSNRDAAVGGPSNEPTGEPEGESGDTSARSGTLGIPHEHDLPSGLVTGGQPSLAALEAARDRGVRTIVSLRAPGEPGSDGEQELVESLGLRFVSIPIANDADITEDNAIRVSAAITDDATTVLHCGSSNRAGAMVALRAFFEQNQPVDASMEVGRQAGLSRSAGAVEALLRQACTEDPVRECP